MQIELFDRERVIVWFSCGAASACASKLSIDKFKNLLPVEVIYCDTLAYEHPDNIRFLKDVENWIGQSIKIIKNNNYLDIMDVFRKKKFLKNNYGAPCTLHMKKHIRLKYSRPTDIHVFGFTFDKKEIKRANRREKENSQMWLENILIDNKISKDDCHNMLYKAGIEQPIMYKLGYHNNNCIGCVKGGAGYWNKIRKDFPERFKEMANLERELGYKLITLQKKNIKYRVWLDELPPKAGRYKNENWDCGVFCENDD